MTELEQAIREVIRDSYEMFGDHTLNEELERLYRERAEQLRRLDDRPQ
jgi:hypothetical protein